MESISELTWLYVKRRPFLREVIKEGVVNYSALARKISIDAFGSLKHENAVKMALVRMSGKLGKVDSDLEAKILSVMKKSTMTIKSKIAVIISTKYLEGVNSLSYAKSDDYITYIVEQNEIEKLPKSKVISKLEQNMNLITIESPEELEDVPGVISHVLGALASEGINVVEFISCYTATLLVIKQSDTELAYRVLSNMIS
ncbi:ACT domain-containing protein [Candidatus Micrarchaeota archaeon]|nr:ACT domain-containing protein [Candidatus Micrarchaeota archaeon]MBU1166278.1 ACT domain-containing protein [Candidatus Micrarchaeota archaeon]MBU1886729.1 ACT domain-containing protein [Candidatus Micrarchaeota archaeon]